MKHIYLFLTLFTVSLTAQDAYHNDLQALLEVQYGLPAADWMFGNTEAANLGAAIKYGGNFSTVAVSDQSFTQAQRASVSAGANPWDAGWKLVNQSAVQTGDKILVVFFLRSEGSDGEVNFFVENNTTFEKEIFLTMNLTDSWTRYLVPVEVANNYGNGALGLGFHLASETQIVEIGGFTALNFDQDVALGDLPNETLADQYGGFEADAPWRAEAQARIEQLRKADLTISVTDANGNAVENAALHVEQVRHRFDFGTAVVASRFPGNPTANPIYQNKLIDLDGAGHGFNTVVFENDLKWDAWEEEWFVNKPQLQDAVAWLCDNDLKIRGHNLVWPGTQYLPDDIPANYGNPNYLKNRIDERIETVMTYPGVGPKVNDWDVLNEIVQNEDIANALAGTPGYTTGRELYVEIFEKAAQTNPDAELWLNDYVTMTLSQTAGDALYEKLKDYTQEIVDAGAPVDGIGFQAHIGGNLYSIYDVLGTLDDFHDRFGLKAKITEFDLPSYVDEDLAATYLRDFMTAVYSHESTDGFLFWNFWDVQTWLNAGSNLYREDWSETPSHAAFTDLLFNEWWTDADLTTDAGGNAGVRAFKGRVEIVYDCDGQTVRDTVNVEEAMTHTIVCDNITTDTRNGQLDESLRIFPNPSGGRFELRRSGTERATVRVYETTGREVLRLETREQHLDLNLPSAGMYFLELRTDAGTTTRRVVVR